VREYPFLLRLKKGVLEGWGISLCTIFQQWVHCEAAPIAAIERVQVSFLLTGIPCYAHANHDHHRHNILLIPPQSQ
jgi:hypothetical protein